MKNTFSLNWFLTVLIFFFILISSSCSKKTEVKPDTTPIKIQVLAAGNVTANQATLNAEINYLNDEKILDFGFIISEIYQGGDVGKKISLGNSAKAGLIQFEYKPLQKFDFKQRLYYKFYLVTDKREYTSEFSSFIVKDFWVDQQELRTITLGDSLLLTGNFKQMDKDVKVVGYVEGYPLKEVEVLKIEDTKLLLKIPTNLAKHENRVDLYINQNLDNLYIDPDLGLAHLKILGKIDFLADKPIYFGDGLRIRSYGLESYFSNFPIYVGNSTFSYYGDQIPLEGIDFTDKKLKLSYFNGQDTIFYEHKLELIKPQPSDLHINQSNFHPGQPFTLSSDLLYKFYGEYNLEIKIDDKVYNSSLHQMATDATYFIPILKQGKYDVEVLSKLYPPVKLRNALDVRPISPKIDPKPYYYNDVIEVSGNFISGVNYYAKLEEFEIFSGQAKGGKLQMTLPYGKFGVQDLLIGAEGSDQVILDLESVPLEIKGGLIESISPLSAYSGDIITIKGRGFDAATGVWIRVADLECKLVSQTKTEIKFLAPNSVRKGKFPVHIEFIFGHDVIESKQLLELK